MSADADRLIDPNTDPLNDPFESVQTFREITQIYSDLIDKFHIDKESGGDRERIEQGLKYLIALVSPQQE